MNSIQVEPRSKGRDKLREIPDHRSGAEQSWTEQSERYLIFARQLNGKMQSETVDEAEALKGTDTPRIYWEISGFLKESGSPVWKKRLLQNSSSLPPSFLFIHESEKLFIGCEERLFVVEVSSGKVIFEAELFAPFFRFYPIRERVFNLGVIIALCELELYAFDIFGNLKWEANFPDVLNSLRHKETILELTDLSGTVYSLDILSGQFLIKAEAPGLQ